MHHASGCTSERTRLRRVHGRAPNALKRRPRGCEDGSLQAFGEVRSPGFLAPWYESQPRTTEFAGESWPPQRFMKPPIAVRECE